MSNTPNNPPEQNQPPQNPPPQNPPPQNPPPQNPLDFISQLLPDLPRNLLTNPLIAQFASRHPLITNLAILVVFSLSGINILQVQNEQKNNELTQSIQKNICETYQDEVYPGLDSNQISISTTLKPSDDNTNNSLPSLNCKYTKNDKTEPKEKEIPIKFEHDRADFPKSYRIEKNTECEKFKRELEDKMNLKDIKFKSPENLSKAVENNSRKPLFNCEYIMQRDNENSKLENIDVVLYPMFADLTKDTKYDEHPIKMENVCRSDYITKKLTGEIREKDPKQEIKLVPKGPILQEYRDIYPVFRWECSYEIQRKQKNGRIRRTTEALGINIDEDYCQQNYPEEATKATHHDYNDPYSLYCTRPDPK
jgi:hypothetical protein